MERRNAKYICHFTAITQLYVLNFPFTLLTRYPYKCVSHRGMYSVRFFGKKVIITV
jgi:hypothetical protein